MSTVKDELARLIQAQPEDSSREEIVRELAFHVMVERGLEDPLMRKVRYLDKLIDELAKGKALNKTLRQ